MKNDDIHVATLDALAPGTATGILIHASELNTYRSADGHKPVALCFSIRDLELSAVDAVGGIIATVADVTSHRVLRARGLSVPVARIRATDVSLIFSRLGHEVTLTSGERTARLSDGGTPAIGVSSGECNMKVVEVARPFRKMGILANIDDHDDAVRAFRLGADGISMWRTENFLARVDGGSLLRRGLVDLIDTNSRDKSRAIRELKEVFQAELKKILQVAGDSVVVVRLLDLPLVDMVGSDVGPSLPTSARVAISNPNPLLSLRGARLGIVYPPIAEFQLCAIVDAVLNALATAPLVKVWILVPFVTDVAEMKWYRRRVNEILASRPRPDNRSELLFGATVETPRGAIVAGQLASDCDFFSFGTNDLTQYTWALDRDLAFASVLERYLEEDIIETNPFTTLDSAAVGFLIEHAISRGRASNSELKVGITGSFGSDIGLAEYFSGLGVDYVGCPVGQIGTTSAAYTQVTTDSVLPRG